MGDSAGSARRVGVGYGAVLMLVGLLVGVAGLLSIQALGDRGPRLGSTTATEEELTTATDTATSAPEAATAAPTSSTEIATTEADAPPTTSSSPESSADDQADDTEDVRTYRMAGGDIVLAFELDEVRLVSVEANDGFELEQQIVDGRLQINLRDGMTHSQLVAWVAGGPQVMLDDH